MGEKNQFRKAMTFDGNTKDGARVIDFLENSCGRKQGILTTLAIIEFIEKYKLEGKSVSDIKQFINSYEYINAVAANSGMGFVYPIPTMANPLSHSEEPPVNKSENTVEEEDTVLKDELNNLASMFQ